MTPIGFSMPPGLGADPQRLAQSPRDAASVEHTAAEMESLFASLLLKEMRQTLEPGSLFGDDASDSCGSLFDLYLGQHMAQAGGLGIAEMVKRELSGARSLSQNEAQNAAQGLQSL